LKDFCPRRAHSTGEAQHPSSNRIQRFALVALMRRETTPNEQQRLRGRVILARRVSGTRWQIVGLKRDTGGKCHPGHRRRSARSLSLVIPRAGARIRARRHSRPSVMSFHGTAGSVIRETRQDGLVNIHGSALEIRADARLLVTVHQCANNDTTKE